MYRLIDSHAHLEELTDLAQALNRARQIGVEAVVCVGVDLQSNQRVLKLAQDYQQLKLYPALGIHPGNIEPTEIDCTLQLIEKSQDKIVAIGEIGLDYWYKQARKAGPARQLQQQIFCKQLQLAAQLSKPTLVHSRGAWRDCLHLVLEHRIEKAVFHWYSGPADTLGELLQKKYFISATPSAAYSKEHQQAIAQAPIERILLETDSPVRYKPSSGEYDAQPQDLAKTLEAVAKIKNLPQGEVAKITWQNAIKFFALN